MSLGVGYDVKTPGGSVGSSVDIASVGGTPVTSPLPVDASGSVIDVTNAKTITGALAALNNTIIFPCSGCGGIVFKLVPGTLSGTILFEGSNDGGVTYDNIIFAIDGNDIGYSATVVYNNSSTSAAILHFSPIHINGAGFTHIRATVTIYNSGTSNGTFYGTSAPSNFVLPSAKISANWSRITDELGSNSWDINGSGAGLVRATSLPLPTGAATSGNQVTELASLASIDAKLTSPLTVQAANLDIRDLVFATDKVDVSGSSIAVAALAQTTVGPTALSSAGANLLVALSGNIGADMTIVFAAYTGQIRVFVSFDNGATYVSTLLADARDGTFYPPATIAYTAETSTQDFSIFIPPGATHVKMDLPSYTGGTATVTIRCNNIQFIPNYGKGIAGLVRNIQWGQQIGGASAPGGEWANVAVTPIAPLISAAGLVTRDLSAMGPVQEGPYLGNDGYAIGVGIIDATTGLIAVIQGRTDTPIAADIGVITRNIPSGTQTVSSKTDLTPSAPVAASVGVASALALAANANRKGLKLINTSNARISLGFGSAAVLDSGVTLFPGGVLNMDEYDFDLGAVNAIASAAASNLAIQEYTT